MAAILSGEMKDTVQINPAGAYGSSLFSARRHNPLRISQSSNDSSLARSDRTSSGAGLVAPACGSRSRYIYPHTVPLAERSTRLLAQGGDDVWGNATWAPDDLDNITHSHGALISFRENSPALQGENGLYNMTSQDAGTWILERTPTTFQVSILLHESERAILTGVVRRK